MADNSDAPIENLMRQTAEILSLGIDTPDGYLTVGQGFLLQAVLIREIAKRLRTLEIKQK